MDDFMQMHIFFFIVSVVTLVLGTLLGIVLWKILRIVRVVEKLALRAEREGIRILKDVLHLRVVLSQEGRVVRRMFRMFRRGIALFMRRSWKEENN